jgi:hypothetical protein
MIRAGFWQVAETQPGGKSLTPWVVQAGYVILQKGGVVFMRAAFYRLYILGGRRPPARGANHNSPKPNLLSASQKPRWTRIAVIVNVIARQVIGIEGCSFATQRHRQTVTLLPLAAAQRCSPGFSTFVLCMRCAGQEPWLNHGWVLAKLAKCVVLDGN